MNQIFHRFEGVLLGTSATGKAYKFHGDFMEEFVWVAVSQVDKVEQILDSVEDGRVVMWISDWLVRKNNWENS